MLLLPNKKKAAAMIVASIGKGSKKPDHVQALGEESSTGKYEVPEDEEGGAGLEACMSDFLAAVEKKDPKGMASALKSAMVCMPSEESEPKAED